MIFISTMDGERKLLKNLGITGNEIVFEDVTNRLAWPMSMAEHFQHGFGIITTMAGWISLFAITHLKNRWPIMLLLKS